MKLNYEYSEIARIVDGRTTVDHSLISSVAYDTRTILDGTNVLFFALEGEFRDGHAFIKEAYDLGVRHFVVSETSDYSFSDAHFTVVSNTLVALQKLASHHRNQFNCPVVGITGSNGKTIVKEWLSVLLTPEMTVVKSPKSYNSKLGVALSLLEMSESCELAIIEAGISHPGEMDVLESMIKPTIGILTNIGTAHLENFSSSEELLSEKMKLFRNSKCLILGTKISLPSETQELISAYTIDPSKYNFGGASQIERQNAQIAIAAAEKLGVGFSEISKRVENFNQLAMRMESYDGLDNNLIINDSYSLDDEALRISLQEQLSLSKGKERVVVIGLKTNNQKKEEKIREIVHEFDPIELKFHYAGDQTKLDSQNSVILLKGERESRLEKLANQLKLRNHNTFLEVNLSNIRNNISVFKSKLDENTKILCMVKAYSYGTDPSKMGEFLSALGVDYLGVAYADEGLELRKAGVQLPILVMNCDDSSFITCIENGLEPAVYSIRQLEYLVKEIIGQGKSQFPIHLKLETGMNRLGFSEGELSELILYLKSQPEVFVKSIYSHLAESGNEDKTYTQGQIKAFDQMSERITHSFSYEIDKHLLNSEGILNHTEAQLDMVRLGIGMYGYIDSPDLKSELKPAIKWSSVVSQIKHLEAGESVGYNRMFTAKNRTTIAIVPVGYADGFRRSLGNGNGGVYINNKYCPTLGNVCMDMIMVDVTNLEVHEGEPVEIIGDHQTIEELALKMETISYEVLTSFSTRIHRVYTRD